MLTSLRIKASAPPRLGQLLLDRGLINSEQLASAIQLQHNKEIHSGASNPYQTLGQILIKQKVIGDKQLRRCLRWQKIIAKTSVWLTLTLSPVHLVHAAGQYNQHSWLASQQTLISFEQHSLSSLASTWASNKELTLNIKQLQQYWPTKNHRKQQYRHVSESVSLHSSGLRYKALLSPKSFGIDATYHF